MILSCMSTPCNIQSFIVWMMDGALDRREGEAQGDEALEGAEGNGDNIGVFRCTAHEDGANEVFCKPVILS